MRAAFDAGARVVELDVHGTSDAQLVVFMYEAAGVPHQRHRRRARTEARVPALARDARSVRRSLLGRYLDGPHRGSSLGVSSRHSRTDCF